jgi:hypothetical protein
MGGEYKKLREMRNAYTVLVDKHEGKRQLGRHRRRCEDNIKQILKPGSVCVY